MKHYLIAERYAKGLAAAIPDPGQLEAALGALNDLSRVYEEHHDLRSVLANPTIDVDRRARILDEFLHAQNPPAPVARLMHVLLRRGRIARVSDVTGVFATLVDQRLNRTAATVTTAQPLASEQEARICQALTAFSGKTVRMACTVDPELIGGVVAHVGGVVIDGSLRTRLQRMKDALLSEET